MPLRRYHYGISFDIWCTNISLLQSFQFVAGDYVCARTFLNALQGEYTKLRKHVFWQSIWDLLYKEWGTSLGMSWDMFNMDDIWRQSKGWKLSTDHIYSDAIIYKKPAMATEPNFMQQANGPFRWFISLQNQHKHF